VTTPSRVGALFVPASQLAPAARERLLRAQGGGDDLLRRDGDSEFLAEGRLQLLLLEFAATENTLPERMGASRVLGEIGAAAWAWSAAPSSRKPHREWR